MKYLLITLLLLNYSSFGQNFPGGLKPLENRYTVIDKVAIEGDSHRQLTDDVLMLSNPITINDITFRKIWISFKSDKLVMMILKIPSASDQVKIKNILSKKYKLISCSKATNDLICYRNGDMEISITKENDLIYSCNKQESF